MALTFASKKGIPPFRGGLIFVLVDITLDASYVAGGWTITAANVGLPTNGTLCHILPSGVRSGYVLEWDQVNSKLKAYESSADNSALTEMTTDTTALNAVVVRCLVIGHGGG